MEAKMDAGPRNGLLEKKIRFKKRDQKGFHRLIINTLLQNGLETNIALAEINL